MYHSKRRIKALSSLEILASVGLTLGFSSWALGQDCGAGDFASGEPCLVDGDSDTINGGCNSDPDAFAESAVVGGSISGSVSTYDAATRDTDWYLVSPAALAAADVDGNGVVVLTHSGSSEMPVVLFIVGLGDPLCSGASVLGTTGWAGPTCGDAGSPSEAVINIADHPNGIVFYIAPGNPDGSSINTGFPCAAGPGGFDYLIDLEIIELPTSCNFDNEPCNVEHPAPGCNDPECCDAVCSDFDPNCCESSWDALCVELATSEDFAGCAPGLGAPVLLATGDDDSVDGYFDVFTDGFGSEGNAFAGGPAWLDHYNPVGGALQNPVFGMATMLFSGADKAALTLHEGIFGTYSGSTLTSTFLEPNVVSDESGNGVIDQSVAHFSVTGGISLDVISTSSITAITTEGGSPAANWTLSYEITNTGGAATIELVRWMDADINWQGNFNNDNVGTGTNGGTDCNRYVYQSEEGSPNFGITISSNIPDSEYVGSRLGMDPDCDGPAPAFGFGSDPDPVWSNGGLPAGYSNVMAGVGNDADGDSGAAPNDGCVPPVNGTDASIGLLSAVTLGAGETATITFTHTYGAITPNGVADCAPGGGGCIWDLDESGSVGTGDLLALFAQWGTDGPADFDGSGAVGTADLLILFANWGDCK